MARGANRTEFRRDVQWGPVVMVSAGGTLVEPLDDRASSLAPLRVGDARRFIDGFRIRRLIEGVRSRPPCDSALLSVVLSRFSAVCDALGDVFAEMDVNPLIVGEDFVRAVDAVLVPRRSGEHSGGSVPPRKVAGRPAQAFPA